MAKYDLDTLRHSSAHLMAQAIMELFPNESVQLGIGPTIENGFYYDIEMNAKLTEENLKQIEEKIGAFGYRVFTDSAPLMEVELARKAGLGWRGGRLRMARWPVPAAAPAAAAEAPPSPDPGRRRRPAGSPRAS